MFTRPLNLISLTQQGMLNCEIPLKIKVNSFKNSMNCLKIEDLTFTLSGMCLSFMSEDLYLFVRFQRVWAIRYRLYFQALRKKFFFINYDLHTHTPTSTFVRGHTRKTTGTMNANNCIKLCIFIVCPSTRTKMHFLSFLFSIFTVCERAGVFYTIQILTPSRGTIKIIGPRWCQNHDYARREAEGIVMVLTSPRAYNFKLCPE